MSGHGATRKDKRWVYTFHCALCGKPRSVPAVFPEPIGEKEAYEYSPAFSRIYKCRKCHMRTLMP